MEYEIRDNFHKLFRTRVGWKIMAVKNIYFRNEKFRKFNTSYILKFGEKPFYAAYQRRQVDFGGHRMLFNIKFDLKLLANFGGLPSPTYNRRRLNM